jgi:ketosteroid isomerase-like protein
MKLKNRTAQIAALALVTLFPAISVLAATDPNRSVFEGIYKAYATAFKDRDAKTIISLETDDFTLKGPDGKTLNRDQAHTVLEHNLAILKTISKIDEDITDIKVENGTATVSVSEKITATTIPDPQGKEHVIDGATKSHDIWIKKGDKWMIKFSEILEDTTMVDGKSSKSHP